MLSNKAIIRVVIAGACFLWIGPASSQPSVSIPTDGPNRVRTVTEHMKQIQSYVKELVENRKVTKAVDAERAKIPPGETRTFEVVMKEKPLPQGGEFIRVQEVKPGPKIHGPGEIVGTPFTVGGGLPLPGNELTPAQKKEMAERVEALKKEEKALKDAEEVQRQLKSAQEAAAKAKAELDAKTAAAAEAALRAKNEADARARAEKTARDAARAEQMAMRDGARVQKDLADARARYQKEGGPYRMPGSTR